MNTDKDLLMLISAAFSCSGWKDLASVNTTMGRCSTDMSSTRTPTHLEMDLFVFGSVNFFSLCFLICKAG